MAEREMKDSGIDHFGSIPSDWNVVPIKSLFSFGRGLPITKKDLIKNGAPVISYGQIHAKNNTGVHISSELIRYVTTEYYVSNPTSLAYAGDFIFADTSEDLAGSGNAVYIDTKNPIFAGYHTIILKAKHHVNHKYLAYIFQTDAWRFQIRSKLTGVKVYSITQSILGMTKTPFPSNDEQKIIVAYLDKKCSSIDSSISHIQKQIKNLEEYKKSVITQAVTKGLDSNVEMKDSGVEWIGKIPYNWKMIHIKQCGTIYAGATPSTKHEEYWDGNIFWITPADYDTSQKYISYGKRNITEEGYNSCSTQLVPTGSIIFSKRAPVGLVGITKTSLCTNQGCLSVVPNNTVTSEYLYYSLCSYTKVFEMLSSGTTFQEISYNNFSNFLIPLPPLNIQKNISEYLNSKCSSIDSAIEKQHSLIDKLNEYKQSLIYNAVTGKIDCTEKVS